jgi:hypothetical protein
MTHRSSEPIETNDDKHIPGDQITEQPRQNGPGPRRTRSMLLKDSLATGGAQLVHLRFMDLIVV